MCPALSSVGRGKRVMWNDCSFRKLRNDEQRVGLTIRLISIRLCQLPTQVMILFVKVFCANVNGSEAYHLKIRIFMDIILIGLIRPGRDK